MGKNHPESFLVLCKGTPCAHTHSPLQTCGTKSWDDSQDLSFHVLLGKVSPKLQSLALVCSHLWDCCKCPEHLLLGKRHSLINSWWLLWPLEQGFPVWCCLIQQEVTCHPYHQWHYLHCTSWCESWGICAFDFGLEAFSARGLVLAKLHCKRCVWDEWLWGFLAAGGSLLRQVSHWTGCASS